LDSLLSNAEVGFPIVRKNIKELAQTQSEIMGLSLRIEANLLRKAFSEAQRTAAPLDKLSYQAELAHIAFWISEFKPISVTPPMTVQTAIDNAALFCLDTVAGPRADEIPFERKYAEKLDAYLRLATSPVSETVSFYFVLHSVEAEVRERVTKIPRESARKDLLEEHTAFQNMVLTAGPMKKIIRGLRYHLYTPQSFATTMEALFALDKTLDHSDFYE